MKPDPGHERPSPPSSDSTARDVSLRYGNAQKSGPGQGSWMRFAVQDTMQDGQGTLHMLPWRHNLGSSTETSTDPLFKSIFFKFSWPLTIQKYLPSNELKLSNDAWSQ